MLKIFTGVVALIVIVAIISILAKLFWYGIMGIVLIGAAYLIYLKYRKTT